VTIAGPPGQFFVYNNVAGPGTLMIAMSNTAGTDVFGNAFGDGLTFPVGNGTNTPSTDFSSIKNAFLSPNEVLTIFGPGGVPGTIFLYDNGQVQINAQGPNGGIILNSGAGGQGLKFGAGNQAGYYDEEWRNYAQVIVSGTPANIDPTAGSVHILTADYPSAWSGATWTCPATGDYTVTSVQGVIFGGTWRNVHRANVNGAIDCQLGVNTAAVNSPGIDTLSFTRKFNAGDTLNILVIQVSGGNLTTAANSRIKIHRNL
jgi:hypothetical protein